MLKTWTEVCLVTDKCKPYEIYRITFHVYRVECFSQKIFTNGLNMDIPLEAWVEKTVDRVKTHCYLSKEKVLK